MLEKYLDGPQAGTVSIDASCRINSLYGDTTLRVLIVPHPQRCCAGQAGQCGGLDQDDTHAGEVSGRPPGRDCFH